MKEYVLLFFIRKYQVNFIIICLFWRCSASQYLQLDWSHYTQSPFFGHFGDCLQQIDYEFFKIHGLFAAWSFSYSLFDHLVGNCEFPVEASLLNAHPQTFGSICYSELVRNCVLENLVSHDYSLFQLHLSHSF